MRLVAFGCSLTEGNSLVNPQIESWPNILASMIGCDTFVNNGLGGASNKHITWIIQNFDFQEDDIVIVLWSHKDRDCIIHRDYVQFIGIWRPDAVSKVFFETFHDDYDMSIDMHTRINYVSNMLDSQNIKNYHCYCDTRYKQDFKWHTTNMLKTNLERLWHEHGSTPDGTHPSKEAYTAFAVSVYNEIKESYSGE